MTFQDWAPVITGVGVLSGVIVTGMFGSINNTRQARILYAQKLAEEKRERGRDALLRVAGALSELSLQGDSPSGRDEGHGAWSAEFRRLLLLVEVAALEITDPVLRARLDHATLILQHSRYFVVVDVQEHQGRHIAIYHGLQCVGAALRGEPIPEQTDNFKAMLQAVDDSSRHISGGEQ